MIKVFSKCIVLAVIAVFAGSAVSHAVEIDLDSYPSYFRTRAKYLNKATYLDPSYIAGGTKDRIFFVDSTLRVTPRLELGDNAAIVVQVDVADNVIWGGQTDQLLGGGSTLVNSGISRSDRYKGNILTPVYDRVAYLDRRTASDRDGFSPAGARRSADDNGNPALLPETAVERDAGWFNLRFAYLEIDLPHNYGYLRVGRQPWNWGLGIVANSGTDPSSDGGRMFDRILFAKTADLNSGSTITGMIFADLWTGGTELRATGAAYDGIGGAVVYNRPAPDANSSDITLGSYIYPWIKQDNFVRGGNYLLGAEGNLDQLTIYSFTTDIKRGDFRFAAELHGAFGQLTDLNAFRDCIDASCNRVAAFNRRDNVDIDHHVAWVARLEFLPESTVQVFGGEFGWVDGDRASNYWENGSLEGGILSFSSAYNADHFLLEHIIPNIYQSTNNRVFSHQSGGIQNTRYARAYIDFKLADRLIVKNQWLTAWTNQTQDLFVDGENISGFIGTELETTFSFRLAKGVFLDLTGSVVFAGDGLKQMFRGQGFNEIVRRSDDDIDYDLENVRFFTPPTADRANMDNAARVTVEFVDRNGDSTTGGQLTAVIEDVPVIQSFEDGATGPTRLFIPPDASKDETTGRAFKRQAYEALWNAYKDQYSHKNNRLWSLQTVLTVHLDSLSSN
ncbi:hypothetical protein [Candidatus Mycalebacterium sp.]